VNTWKEEQNLKRELQIWYMMAKKEFIMAQIHKKFSTDQIKILLNSYTAGHISRNEIEHTLGIGKTRFFALLKAFREEPDSFSIDYHRSSSGRLKAEAEEQIRVELQRDKALVENKELPISGYNYAALTDRLKKAGVNVSTTTVIKRAVQQGCYLPKRKKKDRHDREVLTSAAGDLIQHDASLHKWSPYATDKWTLITSLDDHTRMLLYADFVESETSWAHIQSVQYLMQRFGVPHRYYVDNLRVFRFVQHRDSLWKNMVLGTDDVNTQWRQVLALMSTDVIYAMSPQAKGKIERPYRWLQDRIVRTCALEHITTLPDARSVLREEVHRYNYQQVHSTTQEIPALRFEKAQKENRSLFRPFVLPKPFTSTKDIFCIRHKRISDGYRKITFSGIPLQIPGIEPRDEVELHLVPDETKRNVELRVWASSRLVHTAFLPLESIKKMVHF
jgi:transposase